ncbi:MAG: phytoene/squalene synthase family protein [Beijerinckiaceae bacterium]
MNRNTHVAEKIHPVKNGQDAYIHCEGIVRAADKDRWLATLFAPVQSRPHLHALYAFNQEIARVRTAVNDPLPGEIRFQWWRDLLTGQARGEAQAHPVAASLLATIEQCRLPRQAFLNMIDARGFDLYDDPMPSVLDLEGYAGETASAIMRLAAMILMHGEEPGAADAAGHAGVAYAVTGLLRALPWHARRGQIYIPKDILDRYGVTREDIVQGRGGPGFVSALADMRALARAHVEQMAALTKTIPARIAPAFLPVSLVRGYLAQMEKTGYDPFRTVIDVPPFTKMWTLWRSSRRARHISE